MYKKFIPVSVSGNYYLKILKPLMAKSAALYSNTFRKFLAQNQVITASNKTPLFFKKNEVKERF